MAILRGLLVSLASLVLTVGALFAADRYLQHRQERYAGLNLEAYRGPVLGPKRPREVRIAVLGGSTAFGDGVLVEEAFPYQLEARLRQLTTMPLSVVNLAEVGDSSVCFDSTLRHYSFLRPDVVLIYSGINDLRPASYDRTADSCARDRSAIYRLTGYLPVLPEVVLDKYLALRYGSAGAATAQNPAPASAAQFAGYPASNGGPGSEVSERELIARYVERMRSLVKDQLNAGRMVEVVAEHNIGDMPTGSSLWGVDAGVLKERQPRQRAALKAGLAQFQTDRRFRYVDPSASFNLSDPAESFDDVHLTAHANKQLAEILAGPTLDLILAGTSAN